MINTGMEPLHSFTTLCAIYKQLKALGLVRHQQDFSVNWLGRSMDHYAYLKAHDKAPSAETMRYLTHTLYLKSDSSIDTSEDEQLWDSQKMCRDFVEQETIIIKRQNRALEFQLNK